MILPTGDQSPNNPDHKVISFSSFYRLDIEKKQFRYALGPGHFELLRSTPILPLTSASAHTWQVVHMRLPLLPTLQASTPPFFTTLSLGTQPVPAWTPRTSAHAHSQHPSRYKRGTSQPARGFRESSLPNKN